MFRWWGQAVVRLRWWVVAGALALVAAGATWGLGVFGVLSGGGYDDPSSESSRATAAIADQLGRRDPDVLVLWSSDTATVDDPAVRQSITAAVAAIRAQPGVANVTSYLDSETPALVSEDRRATYAAVQLTDGDADAKMAAWDALEPHTEAAGLRTEAGGNVPFTQQANERTEQDITRAEIFSLPVLLVLLILIFRGVVAALSPLVIGGIAIMGAFVAVRGLTYLTDISVFAINVITLLGLGMAVDYSLFVVSRFREELANGRDVPEAIRITVATAGRTIAVSGLTIVLALSSLLIFPQSFLGSMAIGGMAAVLIAMLAALTVLPAALALLGHRIDKLRIPSLRRRDPAAEGGGWARLAHSVMRRPVLYVVAVLAVLAVFALPFGRVEFGGFDERVMPADTPARIVSEAIREDFPGGDVNPVSVYVPGGGASRLVSEIAAIPGVAGARADGDSLVTVTTSAAPTTSAAREVVRDIRALDPDALVGGRAAVDLDLLESLSARLPWMALIMAVATMLLLFLAFGSVLLPIKAVLMNLVSIGASFGVVVWIFQDGHFEGLLRFESTGFIEPSNMILVLAVLFGLATDYEVFLLSRVREEWDRTGDNTTAVATGLQHTGRIITAAALLLIVVVAGFATGGVSVVKTIGVGMIVAIIVDATLVRALLVPATMRLLGRWNWWAPGPLARVYRRFGIHESDTPEAEGRERQPAAVG
ncbi:MMPL family transporter [Actinoplanes sp. NPDC051633]|uniref:MMPL family transporter n=1 Tax=Actinoplanes sp. NPDC051633 TaxID=3155670 RepID=UPI00342796FF